jgi:hypothetical protein
MKWVTRDYVHFDRVAVPWLIKRFVDPDAEFLFVRWGCEDERPADAIAFAIPGVELGPHDAQGTTFQKVMAKYAIDDPAIETMAKVVEAGVNYVLHKYRPGPEDRPGQIAVGLITLSEGMMLTDGGDAENLAASFPFWDALYRAFRAEWLVERDHLAIPPPAGKGPRPKVEFLRGLLQADAAT